MTTRENVPGDSELVEMLIVHFQSLIKFNSHSVATCFSYSVTEDTSRMYSYPLLHSKWHPCLLSAPFTPPHPFLSLRGKTYACKYQTFVCISHEADQHLIISLSFTLLSFICFVLASHPLLIFFSYPDPPPLLAVHPHTVYLYPSQRTAFNHFVPF